MLRETEPATPAADSALRELVELLKEQLRVKDEQIAGLIAGNGAGKAGRNFVAPDEAAEGMVALG